MTIALIGVDIAIAELAREKSLGGSIELCAKAAGFALDKQLQEELSVDKAQFSRWLSGGEGIVWPKLERLMDVCGNDAPLLWMLYRRNYDVGSLRKQESETERKLREANERIRVLENEREVTIRTLREVRLP